MHGIFGTIMIITDNQDKWVSLLQDNIRIENAIVEEDYSVIYTELGNVIISKTINRQTSHYINKIIIDKEINYNELYETYHSKDYSITDDGEIKLEKTEE